MTEKDEIIFRGWYGRFLKACLELSVVRYCRLMAGFSKFGNEYKFFAENILIPRLLRFERIAFFCASEHTRLLLDLEPDLKNHILCIADNNEALWNKSFSEIPVYRPEQVVDQLDAIFISTTIYQKQLRKQLKSLGFKGQVLAPDDIVPAEYFLDYILEE